MNENLLRKLDREISIRTEIAKKMKDKNPETIGFDIGFNEGLKAARNMFTLDLIESEGILITDAGRSLGAIKTERKAQTSRENGKLGGRPQKKSISLEYLNESNQ